MMPLFAEAPVLPPRHAFLSWLRERVDKHGAACLGEGLTSLSLPLPGDIEIALPSNLPGAWSWTRPAQGVSLLGHGEAVRRAFPGTGELAAAVRSLAWRHLDPEEAGSEPLAFLGHAFGAVDGMGLPPALLMVPKILLRRCPGRVSVVFSHDGARDAGALARSWMESAEALLDALDSSPEPVLAEGRIERLAETPAPTDFVARVEAVRKAVIQGRLEKVVLSRQLRVRGDHPFDPARLVASLSVRYPNCAILSASFNEKVLVAASPERLAAREGERIASIALAGTAPREAGTPFPDRRLLTSDKDRVEHMPVVRHVAGVLSGLCEGELDLPQAPVLMELDRLQHLSTPISGRLKAGVGLLDAARALHPTPAIAGWPRTAALRMIGDLGEKREGWYSGAMGWLDRSGDGEMVVVLRCAVLEGREATLAAGGGIVAASDPGAELAEIELKLDAILDSLKVA